MREKDERTFNIIDYVYRLHCKHNQLCLMYYAANIINYVPKIKGVFVYIIGYETSLIDNGGFHFYYYYIISN